MMLVTAYRLGHYRVSRLYHPRLNMTSQPGESALESDVLLSSVAHRPRPVVARAVVYILTALRRRAQTMHGACTCHGVLTCCCT